MKKLLLIVLLSTSCALIDGLNDTPDTGATLATDAGSTTEADTGVDAIVDLGDASANDNGPVDIGVQDLGFADNGLKGQDSGCMPESDTALCDRNNASCGMLTAQDNCGQSRTVASCGNCTASQTCGGGGIAMRCGCTPQTDAQFCTDLGANCGTVTAPDNCGIQRTADCGGCMVPQTCGGGGTNNVCGCSPETDAQFCARLGANCDQVVGFDNCDGSRTANCGTCVAPQMCSGSGIDNVCGSVTQLAAGGNHTCALLFGGNVRCWGLGALGRLGYGNTNSIGDNELPLTAGNVDVGQSVTALVAGLQHTCALLSTQNVRCWGAGLDGPLGYGNIQDVGDDETPSIAGDINVGGNVAQLAAGNSHTCALLTNGNVRCWGLGNNGRLGYGNTNSIGDNEAPALALNVDVGQSVSQVVAGGDHTCALLTDGNVRCWGFGTFGQLGYGSTQDIGDNESPASAGNVNVGSSVVQLAAGNAHTCALLADNNVRCWGFGSDGRLGYANTQDIGDNETPASAGNVTLAFGANQIVAGFEHTCALLTNGNVQCWGVGANGRLGYANTNNIGDNEIPNAAGIVDLSGSVIQLTAGAFHTCALLSDGRVLCWGVGNNGQLGYGNTNNIGDNETPSSAGDVSVF